MAGMGPPPKDPAQRRRRNATFAMTRLPAEGRTKPAPAWPLLADIGLTAKRNMLEAKLERLQEDRAELLDSGEKVGRLDKQIDGVLEQLSVVEAQLDAQAQLEATLWVDLWRLPQAVEWERLAWLRDVAQYVRFKVLGELGDIDSAKEARMWSDRLGLTPLAMLRLRWEVAHDEVGEKRAEKTEQETAARPARRLKVVDPNAVAGR